MKPKLKPIRDQVVVLFGATSGIGLETAMLMAEKGARVVIVGRSQDGLNDAQQRVNEHVERSRMMAPQTNGSRREWMQGEMGASGVAESMTGASAMNAATTTMLEEQVIAIEADITNWEQVKGVADQVMTRFGRIDTWVNVAAVSEWALFEDTNPEEFKRIIEVNLVGHAYGAMAALPYMRQQDGGALIFVSSIAGRIPIPYQSAYNASKHGILGLAETLRQEMKHTQTPISVTAILPSSINTLLFQKARTRLGVEPDPLPPVYDARMAAKGITYAATHPVRELIIGDVGYVMTFMRRMAPTLTSNLMGASGFRMQRSNEPKSVEAPDNLYHHVSGYNEVEGEHPAKQFSALTWLSTHPKVRLGILGSLVTAIGFLFGLRIVRARAARRRSFSYRARMFGRQISMALASLPLISNLPMFRRRNVLQRAVDKLPSFRRQKTLKDRITSIDIPISLKDERKMLKRGKKKAERATMRGVKVFDKAADKSMKAVEKAAESSKKAVEKVADRGKDAVAKMRDYSPDDNRKVVVERKKEHADVFTEKVARR